MRVKWINELVDANGNYLPHLLPVDPTLHWANPPGGDDGPRHAARRSTSTPGPLHGPGADRDARARRGRRRRRERRLRGGVVPAGGDNIPAGYATEGTWYDFFAGKAARRATASAWGPGFAIFQYPNEHRASTIWYHDHALGMTRLNVYAGPAGFFLVRGGPAGDEAVLDSRDRHRGRAPGPGADGRTTSSRPTRPTTRSRSRSRTARSTPTGRCSTRTAGSSSTGSCATTSRTGTSRRSGTPSSSAT